MSSWKEVTVTTWGHQPRRWPALLATALLLVGCAGPVPTPSPPPTAAPASPTTAPTLTPAPTASPSPSPSSTPTPAAWTELATFRGEMVRVLVAGGPGMIAAGCRVSTEVSYECAKALVRTSSDGSTWTEATVGDAAGGNIETIQKVGDTYVALGTRYLGGIDSRGAVWTSRDGSRWALVATFPGQVANAIVERDGQLLGVGTGYPYGGEPWGFIVWELDGVGHWGEGRVVQTPQGYFVRSVIPTSSGYLAFGMNDPMGINAVIATSTDGLRWRLVPDQASLSGSILLSVVERDGGSVAVGLVAGNGAFTAAVWHSPDGLNWERIEDPGGPIPGQPVRAAIMDGRVLLRGTVFDGEANRTTSWESLDGVHWTSLGPGSDLPDLAGAEVSDPVAVAGRRLVVASYGATDAVRSVIYAQFGALDGPMPAGAAALSPSLSPSAGTSTFLRVGCPPLPVDAATLIRLGERNVRARAGRRDACWCPVGPPHEPDGCRRRARPRRDVLRHLGRGRDHAPGHPDVDPDPRLEPACRATRAFQPAGRHLLPRDDGRDAARLRGMGCPEPRDAARVQQGGPVQLGSPGVNEAQDRFGGSPTRPPPRRALTSRRDTFQMTNGAARSAISPPTNQKGRQPAAPEPVAWMPSQSIVRPVASGGLSRSGAGYRARLRFLRIGPR